MQVHSNGRHPRASALAPVHWTHSLAPVKGWRSDVTPVLALGGGCRVGPEQDFERAQLDVRAPPQRTLVGRPFERLSEICILLPTNQRQHRTLHIQKDALRYALC